ncbi:MAG: hypothetical protein HON04_09465 [Planctomicrobium sp.]|jgi:hypothetical protein|nr:hypothetical protein [Planctomicrobium sp.]
MTRFVSGLLCFAAILSISPETAFSQTLRVSTSVADVSRPENIQQLSYSLTLFHGGRVYDYMPDVGEVVIFEPIHNRFIILGKNFSATEVSFAEINHFLESAQTEAVQYIEELSADPDPMSAAKANAMRFQLSPDFQESYEKSQNLLKLSGTELEYSVEAQPVEAANVVNRYLEYADWAKRLNFVLHRNSSLPQSRIQLNQSLRERKLLPKAVELTMHLNPPVKFRAEHRFADEFQSADRRLISQWERTLQSDQIRWMTFREYQQNLLVQSGK